MKKSIKSKYKIKAWSILALFAMVITFTACEKDCELPKDITEDTTESYPLLKVVNELNDDWRSITSVKLVGYEFYNLNIEYNGDSQTFILDKGMSGGYEDVYVTVVYQRYSGVYSSRSIEVNFSKGETTTITLIECSPDDDCNGIYLQ